MNTVLAHITTYFIVFLQNAWGCLHTPYETYRLLSKGSRLFQVLPVFVLSISYFGWSSLVHHGISAHPYLLTLSFGKLTTGFVITYLFALSSLVYIGRLVGGSGSYKSVFLPWTYTLMPTILWFFTTSIMTLLFPPPRTTSVLGQGFSFFFLSFSLFLFFWKAILYYLTLRFGMRLDLGKILFASLMLFPLGGVYAVVMYSLGIFRVPFI